jgi:dephospho-CoA kinase
VKKKPLLLGITGAFGSGKSTASDFFASKDFTKIELSDFLEEEIRNRYKGKITRKQLQDEGNTMRTKYGSGILAKKALEQIERDKLDRVVISGIRNLGEVEVLCENPHFLLLAIMVDREARFERLQKNPRREKLTSQSFMKLDYRDLGIGEEDSGLQVGMCIAVADVYIDNNGTKEMLKEKLSKYE